MLHGLCTPDNTKLPQVYTLMKPGYSGCAPEHGLSRAGAEGSVY